MYDRNLLYPVPRIRLPAVVTAPQAETNAAEFQKSAAKEKKKAEKFAAELGTLAKLRDAATVFVSSAAEVRSWVPLQTGVRSSLERTERPRQSSDG